MTQYLDFALYGGSSSASSTRGIANNMAPDGFETATATDRGWFISPELTYGVRIPMQDYTLTPRARVRYAAGFFDAFSEQGSAQNLSIASRTVQDVEERLELALSRIDTRAGEHRRHCLGADRRSGHQRGAAWTEPRVPHARPQQRSWRRRRGRH